MAGGYGELLRTRHALRLLAGTLTGRLPNAVATLAVLLFTRAHGGSYTLAGGLSAVYNLGTGAGQPLLGRLVDRDGQFRVLLGGAFVAGLAFTGFALTGPRPLWASGALMAVAGLATPPLEGALRALWPSVLGRPDHGAAPEEIRRADDRLHAAYAMDAVSQEVMFSVGPLLVTLTVAASSTAFALVALAAVGLLGAAAVVTAPPSRRWRAGARETHWLGPLRSPGIVVLLGSLFCVGVALGSVAVAAVAYADTHGGGLVSSYLLSAVGVGAFAGGIAYGAWPRAGAPEGRLRLLVALLALANWPLALAPGVGPMTALAALSGVFLAPTVACAFVVVDRYAPTGTVTEAFSWVVTAFSVGSAAGGALTGPVAQYAGVRAGFAVAGAGSTAALAVLLAGRRALTTSGAAVSGLPASCDSASGVVVGHRRTASPSSSALDPKPQDAAP